MKRLLPLLFITSALSAAIDDKIPLFSQAAVSAASAELDKIRAATGKEILILTVRDTRGKSIREYARAEAAARQLNGLVIVISENPRKLEVMAGKKTQKIFTQAHSTTHRVLEILKRDLRNAPDQSLHHAVTYLREVFAAARGASTAPVSGESGDMHWLKILGICLIIFLVIRLVTHFIASRSSGVAPGMGANGNAPNAGFGVGGFFSSLLGGIFGAVAGNWIYDKIFAPDRHEFGYSGNDTYRSADQGWRDDDRGDFDPDSASESDWGGDGDSGGDW